MRTCQSYWLARMGQNFDDYPDFQAKTTRIKHLCPKYIDNFQKLNPSKFLFFLQAPNLYNSLYIADCKIARQPPQVRQRRVGSAGSAAQGCHCRASHHRATTAGPASQGWQRRAGTVGPLPKGRSDQPNIRFGWTSTARFGPNDRTQNFFSYYIQWHPFIFLFCFMTHMYAAISLVFR